MSKFRRGSIVKLAKVHKPATDQWEIEIFYMTEKKHSRVFKVKLGKQDAEMLVHFLVPLLEKGDFKWPNES